ncbi:hypothetical protein [Helicobacter fennelliae]|nr:hypothetical protein [Helicobacter fennelliae]STQ84428.1 Uncharacterised protein [Helicobacter fennelliae]
MLKFKMLEFWKEYSDRIKRIIKNTAKGASKESKCQSLIHC